MRCPKCGCVESRVVDSRPSDNYETIRRRRECESCGYRFTTYERREETPLMVVKKGGSKEIFDRQKLMRGLMAATVKRDIQVSQLEELIDSIVGELRDRGITEVPSKTLGERVMVHLRELDKVAYVRFASVYRDFKDLDDFVDELRSLSEQ